MSTSTILEVINEGIENAFSNHNKILFGKVEKVNEKTIDIKPSYNGLYNGEEFELPLLVDVIPIFLQGGTSYRADPISVGDYAVIFISDRCIEGWYNGNDNKLPRQYKMHDLSDAFAIVGINQLSNAITVPNVITEIGDKHIEGNHEHIGNVTHTGNYNLTGNLTVTGDIILNGLSLQSFVTTHTHSGVQNGSGNTGAPN